MTQHENFIEVKHPVLKRDLTILRDSSTQPEFFRSAVKRIATVLAVEISKEFTFYEKEIDTPLEKTTGYFLKEDVVIVPVLRAGLGMVSGFLSVLPRAKVGHIGLQRDENTLLPLEYYYKTPSNIDRSKILLLDPMLATGGSSEAAISFLKKRGAKDITFACLVAAPEGVELLGTKHPEVKIYGASLDRVLNDNGYILPGLGDAGDRTFGTL